MISGTLACVANATGEGRGRDKEAGDTNAKHQRRKVPCFLPFLAPASEATGMSKMSNRQTNLLVV